MFIAWPAEKDTDSRLVSQVLKGRDDMLLTQTYTGNGYHVMHLILESYSIQNET